MTANTYGRAVDVPMTNKSGGQVIAGDVVIYDSTTNDSFTTTTSAASLLAAGVAQETIASNGVGRIRTYGYCALVLTSGSVTRLDYGATHTVAKQAADVGASRAAGTFLIFLSSGATPDAIVYPVDLAGAALTNPMSGIGDLIRGGASGAPTRLAPSAAGKILTDGGAGVTPAWGQGPLTTTGDLLIGATAGTPTRLATGAAGTVLIGGTTPAWGTAVTAATATVATDQSLTGNNSWVDLTTAGPSATVTIGPLGIALVSLVCHCSNGSAGWYGYVSYVVSGANTIAVGTNILGFGALTSGVDSTLGASFVVTGLTAGSTTFKMQYNQVGGAGTTHYANRQIGVIAF